MENTTPTPEARVLDGDVYVIIAKISPSGVSRGSLGVLRELSRNAEGKSRYWIDLINPTSLARAICFSSRPTAERFAAALVRDYRTTFEVADRRTL